MKSHSHLCECNLFVVVAISRAAAAVVVVVVDTTTTAIVLFYFIFFLQNILLSSALAISIAIFFISIWILFHFILFAYEQNNHFDFPPVCLIAACGSHLFIGAFHWGLTCGWVCGCYFVFFFFFVSKGASSTPLLWLSCMPIWTQFTKKTWIIYFKE